MTLRSDPLLYTVLFYTRGGQDVEWTLATPFVRAVVKSYELSLRKHTKRKYIGSVSSGDVLPRQTERCNKGPSPRLCGDGEVSRVGIMHTVVSQCGSSAQRHIWSSQIPQRHSHPEGEARACEHRTSSVPLSTSNFSNVSKRRRHKRMRHSAPPVHARGSFLG
ncbi:hypothetical protein AAFF_G00113710 [Aldrovandia affinis]|uniref:Uncharacterized protein n=1 Tax=Aldrovandia affinis TaxID=143900 RepID=A0AAD7RTE2_9TELE|nr:hypothetical protein AAFF_G00113710 [Aldrovandia affinis]